MSDKKKIFISWSKGHSKKVASILNEYLPDILEGVEVFMSDKDIDPGERSMKAIEQELAGTDYGILVVTAENQRESWLNFEAGALSKQVGTDNEDVPHVVPVLVDIESPSELVGPISQFQAVRLTKEDLRKTCVAISKLLDSDVDKAKRVFDRTWPEIEGELSGVTATPRGVAQPTRTTNDKIDEILEILRTLQRATPSDSSFDLIAARDAQRQLATERFHKERTLAARVIEAEFGGRLTDATSDERGRLVAVKIDRAGKALDGLAIRKSLKEVTGRNVDVFI